MEINRIEQGMNGHITWNNLKILVTKNTGLSTRLRESASLHSETASLMLEAADVIDSLRRELRELTDKAGGV